jgi:hypothetical protein
MATKKRRLTLAQQRANPALRSKLPISRLTPAQQTMRRYNQKVARQNKDPLYDPSAALSGHTLAAAAGKVANAQLAPQLAAIDTQSRQATTQSTALVKRAQDYYAQMAGLGDATTTRAQALAALSNKDIANVNDTERQAFEQLQAGEAQRQAADAAQRGGGLGGDTSIAPTAISQLAGTATANAGAATRAATVENDSWAQLANAMTQAGGLRGQETQQQLLNAASSKLAGLGDQRRALESTRGDLTTKSLLDLRQQSFENAATVQGLGLDQSKLAAQLQQDRNQTAIAKAKIKQAAKQARAQRRVQMRGQDVTAHGQAITARGQDISSADRAKDRAAKAAAEAQKTAQAQAKARVVTRTKAAKAWDGVESTLGKMGSARVPVLDKDGNQTGTRPAKTQETLGALRSKNVPEWQVKAALWIRHSPDGRLTPAQVEELHRANPEIRIPAKYRPRRGSAPTIRRPRP